MYFDLQIDVEKFARYLPLHLIAVIMAWERDKSTFKYLLCGILLLHSMCDLASRVPKIEQVNQSSITRFLYQVTNSSRFYFN